MAATATVRVTEKTRDSLRELAEARGATMPAVLEEIVAKAQDDALLEQMTVDFARLGADPAARADYQAEASAWEATLVDGLDDLEP